jgi:hypothetical protein
MNHELFEMPMQLSPRLQWIKKHNICTQKFEAPTIAPEFRWVATSKTITAPGPSEDDAIVNLAKLMKIKLWNES